MRRFFLVLCLALFAAGANAAVIGTITPTEGISQKRVAALPAEQRAAWSEYLARSQMQHRADMEALAAERKGLAVIPPSPAEQGRDRSMPLDRAPDWYVSAEARHVADVIVSFQTPAGGWGKNQGRSGALRQRGQFFVAGDERGWDFVGTIDNSATTTELRFLALVATALPGADGDRYRQSFERGLRYLLAAQFPNGGWPQVWPLQGGYHDAVTFNDDAVARVVALMQAVAMNEGGAYGFVAPGLREDAAGSVKRALDCILAAQLKVDGRRTIWGAQHDALTLAPVAARNFEPASLSSAESAGLLLFLMRLPDPSPEVVAAVHDGVAWLKRAARSDQAWTETAGGRRLVEKPGAPPLWSRFYAVGPADSARPLFGDRDKTIHDDVSELSAERRNGYAWYVTSPQKAIKAWERWSKAHPPAD